MVKFTRRNSLLTLGKVALKANDSVPKADENDEVEANKATASLIGWMVVAVVACFFTYNERDGADTASSVAAGLVGFAFSQTPALLTLHAPFQYLCLHFGLPFVGGGAIMVSQVGDLKRASVAWFAGAASAGALFLVAMTVWRWRGKKYVAAKVEEGIRETPPEEHQPENWSKMDQCCGIWHQLFYTSHGKYGVLIVNVLSFIGAAGFLSAGSYGVNQEKNESEYGKQFGYLAVPQLGIGFAFSLMGILSIKKIEEEAKSGAVFEFIFWVCGLFVEILPLTLEIAMGNVGDNMDDKRALLQTVSWVSFFGNFMALGSFSYLFSSLFEDEEKDKSADAAVVATPTDVNTRSIVLPPAGQKTRGLAETGPAAQTRDAEILKPGVPKPAELSKSSSQEQPKTQGSSASIVHQMPQSGPGQVPGMVPMNGPPGYGYNFPGYGMQQFGGPMGMPPSGL